MLPKTTPAVLDQAPAAARLPTRSGAEAFTRFYLQSLNEAFKTGDTRTVNSLARSTCPMCVAMSEGADRVKARGEHYGKDLVKIISAETTDLTPRSARVLTLVEQQAGPILNRKGAKVGAISSGEIKLLVTLAFEKRWVIARLQKLT